MVFDPSLSGGTISLAGTPLPITKNLTIDVSSLPAGITVSGDVTGDGPTPDDSRCFDINSVTAVEIRNLAIVAGHTTGNGGGISNVFANLTLTDVTLSDNSANQGGGIHNNGGTITLTRSRIRDNTSTSHGGGIYNAGPGWVRFSQSTISGNHALTGGGGAIFDFYSTGGTTLADSTLSGNAALFGGGIYTQNSPLAATNSTIADNTATGSPGGGLYVQNSPAVFSHVTISRNGAPSGGGGLVAGSSPEIPLAFGHTIIAGNTSSTGADIGFYGGLIISTGANLIGDNDTAEAQFPAGLPNANGDRVGAPALLAPLGDYGGPTRTMPPLPGSPAIEGGVLLEGAPATDQRGAVRPSGPLPDLGAVEAFPFSTLRLVDTDNDGIDDRIEPAYPQFLVGRDDHALDSDGDGSPDGGELASMTDPADPNDRLRLITFAPAADFHPATNRVFRVVLATFPGLAYEFEASAALDGFEVIPAPSFLATGFTTTVDVTLPPGRQFLRAARK